MQNSLRLFIALELSQDIHDQLSRLIQDLKKCAPLSSVKWVKSENIHLTVKFLGETPQAKIPQLQQTLTKCCQNEEVFQLVVKGTGVFPSKKQPRLLWVGVEAGNHLIHLVNSIESGLIPIGFQKEERPFSPHLTLARINSPADPAAMNTSLEKLYSVREREFGRVIVRRVTLFQSTLSSDGPTYTPLARVQLAE
jgi:2'-5' RNA ligase